MLLPLPVGDHKPRDECGNWPARLRNYLKISVSHLYDSISTQEPQPILR
jgi:hypothetical protein